MATTLIHAAAAGMAAPFSAVAVVEERHEFLATYEGPFHPSSSSSSGNRKTFCITLPPTSIGFDGKGSVSSSSSSYVSEDDLLACLSAKIGWPSSLLCIAQRRNTEGATSNQNGRLLFPTHSLQNNRNAITVVHHQHAPLTITIAPRHTLLLGGKGGFGTLLKGQSKQAGARTTLDFGACRDLSGRRLRHVNDEIKLRKFRELQDKRSKGENVDELAALKTPSGIRNWHLMVPGWSDGAAFSNKGRRKIERGYEREVRRWQSKEERAKSMREERRMEEEWAVLEYVKRGERESKRAEEKGEDLKEGILAHFRKRKLEKQQQQQKQEGKQKDSEGASSEAEKSATSAAAAVSGDDDNNNSSLPFDGATSLASHLMTLSGEMSVFDIPNDSKLRIQSQSDFATVVVLLNPSKLKGKKRGVYVEYTIQTAGLAQIGWIQSPNHAKAMSFLPNSDTGDGVGDDASSFGYDGSRGLKFHDGKELAYGSADNSKHMMEWKAGDVLGCWCVISPNDKNTIEMGYSLNGTDLGVAFTAPTVNDAFDYYPAVSLNLNEVVDVNVGPDFAFDVKAGCVGACELVKTVEAVVNVGNCEDGSATKEEEDEAATEDKGAPLRKRPREESTEQSAKSEGEKTKEEGTKAGSSKTDGTKESFDLNTCTSLDVLKEMDPDRLKNILLSMGVKCGGAPYDRAKRLFSLKGLSRADYPKKVRGKNFVL